MYSNILIAQASDGLGVPVHAPQAAAEDYFEPWQVAEEMVVRYLAPELLPQRLDGVHVRRILGQEEQLEPFVSCEPGGQLLGLVPAGVVQDEDDASSGTTPQDVSEEPLELAAIDHRSQPMMDTAANDVDGAEDMGLAAVPRPRPDADLMTTKAPGAGQRRIELDGRLVPEQDRQAPEVAGAAHKKRQGPFFLARSRGSLPGSSCVGRRRRHPILWS